MKTAIRRWALGGAVVAIVTGVLAEPVASGTSKTKAPTACVVAIKDYQRLLAGAEKVLAQVTMLGRALSTGTASAITAAGTTFKTNAAAISAPLTGVKAKAEAAARKCESR